MKALAHENGPPLCARMRSFEELFTVSAVDWVVGGGYEAAASACWDTIVRGVGVASHVEGFTHKAPNTPGAGAVKRLVRRTSKMLWPCGRSIGVRGGPITGGRGQRILESLTGPVEG